MAKKLSCFGRTPDSPLAPLQGAPSRIHCGRPVVACVLDAFLLCPFSAPAILVLGGIPGHEPLIAGAIIYPNLIVVAVFVILTATGWSLGRAAVED